MAKTSRSVALAKTQDPFTVNLTSAALIDMTSAECK